MALGHTRVGPFFQQHCPSRLGKEASESCKAHEYKLEKTGIVVLVTHPIGSLHSLRQIASLVIILHAPRQPEVAQLEITILRGWPRQRARGRKGTNTQGRTTQRPPPSARPMASRQGGASDLYIECPADVTGLLPCEFRPQSSCEVQSGAVSHGEGEASRNRSKLRYFASPSSDTPCVITRRPCCYATPESSKPTFSTLILVQLTLHAQREREHLIHSPR